MSIHIEIGDGKIINLSDEAKQTLENQTNLYVENIIKEANLIEEGNRENGASREITSSIILQATRKYRNTESKKNTKGLIILKIISSISLLITGFLFDIDGYQDNTIQLYLFIIMFSIACISTVLQFVKEG